MALHHDPLVVVERARLVEDRLGDPDLADVVHQRADLDRIEIRARVAEPLRKPDRDVGDALGVTAGVVVLRLHRARQRRDRLEVASCAPPRRASRTRAPSRAAARSPRAAAPSARPRAAAPRCAAPPITLPPASSGVAAPRGLAELVARAADQLVERVLRVAGQRGCLVGAAPRGRRRTRTGRAGRRSSRELRRSRRELLVCLAHLLDRSAACASCTGGPRSSSSQGEREGEQTR